jgi:hypothetical protein
VMSDIPINLAYIIDLYVHDKIGVYSREVD